MVSVGQPLLAEAPRDLAGEHARPTVRCTLRIGSRELDRLAGLERRLHRSMSSTSSERLEPVVLLDRSCRRRRRAAAPAA